ncbi:uncharacterized protein BN778_00076 [Mycoplasma sp. CAG:776]|nr:uncharacterized protein BN778_00076 [Mycoplasma sp. CAG:776]
MKILNKLTIKHLFMNKKRTLVTIIGITLSTALMVGIGLLTSTYLESMRLDAINNYGSYHLMIEGVNQSELEKLEANIEVENSYYYVPLGNAKVDSTNLYKPYLYVSEASQSFLETLNLIEGRLPQNSNEIVISEHVNQDGDLGYEIGDTLTLDIGKRVLDGESLEVSHNYAMATSWEGDTQEITPETLEVTMSKTYTIVGVVERTVYEDFSSAGYMVFSLDTSKNKDLYNIYLEFSNPSKSYEYTENIISSLNLEDHGAQMNQNLLYYYGASQYDNINNTFLPLILIALTVISVGCIIVIYNSFAISTMERKKSFGLYSSVGATGKQIRKTVLFEAFVVGFIGILLGLIGGFLGIYIVVLILNHLVADILGFSFVFHADLLYLIIPILFMIVVIFLSAYLPAKRSSKITPIEAIRGNDDIKISKKEVKTPKFIRRFFGIEGDIAYKNIKRNKKKYHITVISLFISIVMFNTFTSYLSYTTKASDAIDYYDYDIGVTLQGTLDEVEKDMDLLERSYDIDESIRIYNQGALRVLNLEKNDFTLEYQNFGYEDIVTDTGLIFNVYVLGDREYAKLTDEESLLINSKYFTVYSDSDRTVYDIDVLSNKEYDLQVAFNEKEFTLHTVVTDEEIKGLKNILYSNVPILVVSLSTYQNMFGDTEDYYAKLAMFTKEYQQINDDIEDRAIIFDSTSYVYSPAIDLASTKNLVLAIQILFYGFIALVTLIGVTSVFNTINTNINLRRKEFAMLRSIGLTPRGFNKILFFESLFFGLKSLLYGIPVSIGINALIALSLSSVFDSSMIIPWNSLILSVIGVFIIVLIAMWYSASRVKKENILEALREENI